MVCREGEAEGLRSVRLSNRISEKSLEGGAEWPQRLGVV